MLDRLSEYLAPRKGLLPLIGLLLIAANLVIQFIPLGWVRQSNLLLHIGIIVAIFGLMLAWAL
jgi:hypothetical protein